MRDTQVVDIEDLQSDERSKVDAFLANIKQEELQSLRNSIATTPQVVAALKARGASPRKLSPLTVRVVS